MGRCLKQNIYFLVVIFVSILLLIISGADVFADQSQNPNIAPIKFTKDIDSVKENLYGVTFGNNMFVAVGRDGMVRTSSDGITWSTRNTSTQALLLGIVFASNKFVAVGFDGTIISSIDGITWKGRTSGTNNRLNAITWNGNKYVAVGASGTIVYFV